MGDGFVAAVALSVRWVAEKAGGNGARCVLMRRSGGDARVAQAAEDAKPFIRGRCTEEKVVRCKVPRVRHGRMLMRREAVARALGQKRGGTLA